MAWLLSYEVIGGGVFERREVFKELYCSRNAALRAYEKVERELSFARLRVNFFELCEVKKV
ncbi:MAG: hypothetical protein K2I20_03580 [Clostridia bacterium]|nr:hypothetical protein [Clostridia bacterium]MDE7214995.1 hypothetical protein [Clostridia bacterium]